MPDALLGWALSPATVGVAQILVVAVAAGFSLYGAVATLGIASLLGLTPPLPPGMSGLENELVIVTACVLLVLDALVDRERLFVATWNGVHALIKASAAALLCASAVTEATPPAEAALCAAAALTALLAHAFRYGLRVAARLPAPPTGGLRLMAIETLLTVGMVMAALRFPLVAVVLAAAATLLLGVGGWRAWRAFAVGIAAQAARVRAFLGETGWREGARLPAAVRAALPDDPLAAAQPRAAPAVALRLTGARAFRRGWLVVTEGRHLFVYRGWVGTRVIELPPELRVLGRAAWGEVVGLGGEEIQLLLLRNGPGPERLDRTLRAVAARA